MHLCSAIMHLLMLTNTFFIIKEFQKNLIAKPDISKQVQCYKYLVLFPSVPPSYAS